MKTSFLMPILFLLLTSLTATAQLSLSLEAGVNRTNITLSLAEPQPNNLVLNREPNQGFYIAAIPRLAVGDRFSINTEVQYSMENFKWVSYKYRLQNIRLIPEVEYKVLKSLGIYAGANIGLKVSEAYKRPTEEEWRDNSGDETVGSIKDVDYGVSGGLRYYFLKRFNLTFKYYHGLANISNSFFTDDNGQILESEEYNRTFQLGVGYNFNKKTKS